MDRKIVTVLLAACFCLASQGCTHRAWYEGFQEQQRQECLRIYNRAEMDRCLDKVNAKTYDEYKRDRENDLGQSKKRR